MKQSRLYQILVYPILFLITFNVAVFSFDRENVTKYANQYATQWNDRYYWYGEDCTNYASQCYIAGGITFNKGIDDIVSLNRTDQWKNGWDTTGTCLIRVADFAPAVINDYHCGKNIYHQCFENRTDALTTVIPNTLKKGDYIYIGIKNNDNPNEELKHSVIVVYVPPSRMLGEVLVATHGSYGANIEPFLTGSYIEVAKYFSLDNSADFSFNIVNIIHMPDAPVVRRITVKQNINLIFQVENKYISLRSNDYSDYKEPPGYEGYSLAPNVNATVTAEFDTPMKEDSTSVKFLKAESDEIVNADFDTWSKSNPDNESFDTWTGTFKLDSEGIYKISIDGVSVDGLRIGENDELVDDGMIDEDGKLNKYEVGLFEQFNVPSKKIKKTAKLSKCIPASQSKYLEGSEMGIGFELADFGQQKRLNYLTDILSNSKRYNTVLNYVSSDSQSNGIRIKFINKDSEGNETDLTYPKWFSEQGTNTGLANSGQALYWPKDVPTTGLNITPELLKDEENNDCYKYLYNGIELPLRAYPVVETDIATGEQFEAYRYEVFIPYAIRSFQAYTAGTTTESQFCKIEGYVNEYPFSGTVETKIAKRESTESFVSSANDLFIFPDLMKYCSYENTSLNSYLFHIWSRDGKSPQTFAFDAGINGTIIGRIYPSPDGTKIAFLTSVVTHDTEEIYVDQQPHESDITKTHLYIKIISTASPDLGTIIQTLDVGEFNSSSCFEMAQDYSYSFGTNPYEEGATVEINWASDSSNVAYVVNKTRNETDSYTVWEKQDLYTESSSSHTTYKRYITESTVRVGSDNYFNITKSYNTGFIDFSSTTDFYNGTQTTYSTVAGGTPESVIISKPVCSKNGDIACVVSVAEGSTTTQYIQSTVDVYSESGYSYDNPVFSPDGELFAFSKKNNNDQTEGLWLKHLEGGSATEVISDLEGTNISFSSSCNKVLCGDREIRNLKEVSKNLRAETAIQLDLVPVSVLGNGGPYSSKDNCESGVVARSSGPTSGSNLYLSGAAINLGICTPVPFQTVGSRKGQSVVEVTGTIKGQPGVTSWNLSYAKLVNGLEQAPVSIPPYEYGNGKMKYEEKLAAWDVSSLSDGDYKLKLSAIGASGSEEMSVDVRVCNNQQTIDPQIEVSTYTVPSSEPMKLKMTLGQDSWTTIKVLNSNGDVVATLSDNYVYPAGESEIIWYGTKDDGSLADQEMGYKFSVQTQDSEHNMIPVQYSSNFTVSYASGGGSSYSEKVAVRTISSESKVFLQWDAANNAEKYEVYRNNAKVCQVANTYYIDSSSNLSGTYTYNVVPLDSNGSYGQLSDDASVIVGAEQASIISVTSPKYDNNTVTYINITSLISLDRANEFSMKYGISDGQQVVWNDYAGPFDFSALNNGAGRTIYAKVMDEGDPLNIKEMNFKPKSIIMDRISSIISLNSGFCKLLNTTADFQSNNSSMSNIDLAAQDGKVILAAGIETNLALNKPVSADSAMSSYIPEIANDGVYTGNFWVSDNTDTTHWWRVDLSANKVVNKVKAYWGTKGSSCVIETSSDNINWTPQSTNGNSDDYIVFPSPVTCSYVRWSIIPNLPSGVTCYEFEVWGSDSGVIGYFASGSIQNDISFTTDPVSIPAFKVNEAVPSGTNIVFEVKGAASQEALDSAVAHTVTLINGEALLSDVDKHKWYRVKATLSSTNNILTPVLDSWEIKEVSPLSVTNGGAVLPEGRDLVLSASDNLSGVKQIKCGVNTETLTDYVNALSYESLPATFSFKYSSTDNVDNVETPVIIQVSKNTDLIPPNTEISYDGPNHTKTLVVDNVDVTYTFIKSATQIILTASDNTEVLNTKYSIDTNSEAPSTVYNNEPFSITEAGLHTIYYRSTDTLNNVEDVKSIKVYVDDTAPVTTLQYMRSKLIDSYQDFKTNSTSLNNVCINDGGDVTVNRTWTSSYEADGMPGTDWTKAGDNFENVEVTNTSAGYLYVKTPDQNSGITYTKNDWNLVPFEPSVAEIRAKLISGTIYLIIDNGVFMTPVRIWKKYMYVGFHRYDVDIDDNFHTYQITTGGVSIDGVFYEGLVTFEGTLSFGVWPTTEAGVNADQSELGEVYFDYVRAYHGYDTLGPDGLPLYNASGSMVNTFDISDFSLANGVFKAEDEKPADTNITYKIQYSTDVSVPDPVYGTIAPSYTDGLWDDITNGSSLPSALVVKSAKVMTTLTADTANSAAPVLSKLSVVYSEPVPTPFVDNKVRLLVGNNLGFTATDDHMVNDVNVIGVGVDSTIYKLYKQTDTEPAGTPYVEDSEVALTDQFFDHYLKFASSDLLTNAENEQQDPIEINPINTLAGNNVSVSLGTVSEVIIDATFAAVSAEGLTKPVIVTNATALPANCTVLGSYVDISTTAAFNENSNIVITMQNDAVTSNSRLYHFTNGAWIDVTSIIDTLNHTVTGTVTSLSVFALANVADITAPETAISQATNTFVGPNTEITLSATDDFSGVASIKYSIYLTGSTETKTWYDYAGFFYVPGSVGDYTIEYYSSDVIGNNEIPKTILVHKDTEAPVSSLYIDNIKRNTGTFAWFVDSEPLVTLSATDLDTSVTPAINGSGAAITKYQIDSGSWQTYAGPFTVPAGQQHIVRYYSIDHVGNDESVSPSAIKTLTVYTATKKYWVAGAGNWSDDTNHWATVSGGIPGAGNNPGVNDYAIFDLNSGIGNCSIDQVINIAGVNLGNSDIGVILDGNPATIGYCGLTESAGTFTGGSADVTCNGKFILSGGSFTAPLGLLTVKDSVAITGGAFAHNNGSIRIVGKNAGAYGNTELAFGGAVLNNLHLSCLYAYVRFKDDFTVKGNLDMDTIRLDSYDWGRAYADGGNRTINLEGNFEMTSTFGNEAFGGGESILTLNLTGAGNQTFTKGGGSFFAKVTTVNKPSNKLVLGSNFAFGNDVVTTGERFDVNSHDVTFFFNNNYSLGSNTYKFEGVSFGNLTINSTYGAIYLDSDLNVNGNLNITCNANWGDIRPLTEARTINLYGNFNQTGTSFGISGNDMYLSLVGEGDQTITKTGGTFGCIFTMANKPSGKCVLGSNFDFKANTVIPSGKVLDVATYDVAFVGTNNGSWETFTTGGAVFNNLTLNCVYSRIDLADDFTVNGNLKLWNNNGEAAHVYPANGVRTIAVRGDFEMIYASTFQNVEFGDGSGNLNLSMEGANNAVFTTGAGSKFRANLKINKESNNGIVTNSSPLTIIADRTMEIARGTFDTTGKNLSVTTSANFTNSGRLVITGDDVISTPVNNAGSIVKYNASSGSRVIKDWTYSSLELIGAATYALPSSKALKDLTITGSTLDATTNNYNLSVSGNWTNVGGDFNGRANTVTLNGAVDQVVTTNGKLFNNLIISNSLGTVTFNDGISVANSFVDTSTPSVLNFAGNSVNAINNITLTGTGSGNVCLRSTVDGLQWYLNVSGVQNISYADIKDSNASNGNMINAINNCVDSGNNTNYRFLPEISSVSPAEGFNNGDSVVVIYGRHFYTGVTVKITKGELTIDASDISITKPAGQLEYITCTLPLSGASIGAYDITVTNTDSYSVTLTNGFTVNAAPAVVSGLMPMSGNNSSSLTVDISGTGFFACTETSAVISVVLSGPSNVSVSFSDVTDTSLKIVVPAGVEAGEYSILVTTSAGTSAANAYTYNSIFVPPPSVVTGISPVSGKNDVLTPVVIAGSGFYAGTAEPAVTGVVLEGSVSIPLTGYAVNSDSQISAAVPLGLTAGVYTVKVSTTAGTSSEAVTYTVENGDPKVLYMRMEGADNSTVFTDSSTTVKTITAYGNSEISTEQTKLGDSSAYFDGTSDYLTTPDSQDFYFGSGDFTVDMWVRFESFLTGSHPYRFCGQTAEAGEEWSFYYNTEDTLNFNDPSGLGSISCAWNPEVGTWYHVAAVRNGNTFKMYVDGNCVKTEDVTGLSTIDRSCPLSIAGWSGESSTFHGWMDEVRITKGLARWTSNFDPLGEYNVLNLKMEGDNGDVEITDSENDPKTVTVHGNAAISTVSRKFGGSSLYLDGGTSNYLTVQNGADFDFGSGDFTIDCWFNIQDTTGQKTIFAGSTDWWLQASVSGNAMCYYASSSGTSWDLVQESGSTTITPNAWHHFSYVRHGNVWTGYIDGQQDFTKTVSGTLVNKSEDKRIGLSGNAAYGYHGYLDNFRVSKGVARWTTNFDPPGNINISANNPGFELWNNGDTFTDPVSDTTSLADTCKVFWNSGDMPCVVSKESSLKTAGSYSLKITMSESGVTAASWGVSTQYAGYSAYKGKTIRITADVFCSAANKAGIYMTPYSDRHSQVRSSFAAEANTWTSVTVDLLIPADANDLQIGLGSDVSPANNEVYIIDNIKLYEAIQ